MKYRIKSSICILVGFIMLAVSSYIYDYYRASEDAMLISKEAEYLNEDNLVFGEEDSDYGIIFYPGGKVQCEAYAPLMKRCAEEGMLCVLIAMPANLAVLDIDAAEGIPSQYPNVEKWYMAGHSLGGSMAAAYVEEHTEEYDGLILLASYSTADISDTKLNVLSIYGTEDYVLNSEKYAECVKNLPEGYKEVIIDGGNHAYFGDYGEQDGDGTASISRLEQQKQVVEVIKMTVK